jgi:hypothetical protein
VPAHWTDLLLRGVPHREAVVEARPAIWLEGPQRFVEEVVGESVHFQSLLRIAGGRDLSGHRMNVAAWLMPEFDNPHDATAVRVEIRGVVVGHLQRARAAAWHPVLVAFSARYTRHVACPGEIRGGFPLADGEQAFYGVRVFVSTKLR